MIELMQYGKSPCLPSLQYRLLWGGFSMVTLCYLHALWEEGVCI